MSQSNPYFLIVDQIPDALGLQTWQKFKDFVRAALKDSQPGWAEIFKIAEGWYAGTCSLKSKADGDVAYTLFREYAKAGWHVHADLFDLSSGTAEIIKCSGSQDTTHRPSTFYVERINYGLRQQHHFSTTGSPTTFALVLPAHGQYTTANMMDALANNFQSLGVNPAYYTTAPDYYGTASAASAASPLQHAVAATPVYAKNSNGLPVNVTHGGVAVECREVIFKNLSSKTKEEDLLSKIKKAAKPLNIDFKRHPDTGKSTGTAVAHFASGKDAKRVVKYFQSYPVSLGNRPMTAELGNNLTPTGGTIGLTVVDGSGL